MHNEKMFWWPQAQRSDKRQHGTNRAMAGMAGMLHAPEVMAPV